MAKKKARHEYIFPAVNSQNPLLFEPTNKAGVFRVLLAKEWERDTTDSPFKIKPPAHFDLISFAVESGINCSFEAKHKNSAGTLKSFMELKRPKIQASDPKVFHDMHVYSFTLYLDGDSLPANTYLGDVSFKYVKDGSPANVFTFFKENWLEFQRWVAIQTFHGNWRPANSYRLDFDFISGDHDEIASKANSNEILEINWHLEDYYSHFQDFIEKHIANLELENKLPTLEAISTQGLSSVREFVTEELYYDFIGSYDGEESVDPYHFSSGAENYACALHLSIQKKYLLEKAGARGWQL